VIQEAGALVLVALALSGNRERLTWWTADQKIDLSDACNSEQVSPFGCAQVVTNAYASAIGMIVIVGIDCPRIPFKSGGNMQTGIEETGRQATAS